MIVRSARPALGAAWLVLGAASALAPLVAAAGLPVKPQRRGEDLAVAQDSYHRATINKDTRALSALVTDDYMLVNSDASVQDKASYLADFLVPGFKIDPYRMEDSFSNIQGGAALTGGTFRLRWTQNGRGYSRHLRASHFWVRHDRRWRLAYSQLTRISD